MDFGKCTSIYGESSTSQAPMKFPDNANVEAKEEEETGREAKHAAVADVDIDLREIYFLMMHFLSVGPCHKTFMQFRNELLEHELLPRRYHAWYSRNGLLHSDVNNDDSSFPLCYDSVAQRYSHIEKDHLVKLLKKLMVCIAPSRGVDGRAAPSAADVPTLLGVGPYSLLEYKKHDMNPEIKPLPSYLRWPHMQSDQVRGITLREIGGGFPKHHRAPSIKFACYAIAKPSTMVQKMQNIKRLRGHRAAVYCAIFDRSGRYVVTGSDDRLVKIWSMETAFCLASCRGHEGDITDLAVSFNNALVASASNDYSIRVWRLPDGLPISVLRGHVGAVTAIAFSPRHSSVYQLLSSSDDGTCRIWDARYSHCNPHIYLPNPKNVAGNISGLSSRNVPPSTNTQQNHHILCCAYNASGNFFVTGSSDTYARVWSSCKPNIDESEQPKHEIDLLAGHENDVNYVQFSGCAVTSRSTASDSLTDKTPKFKNSWYSHDNIVTCSRDGSAIIWISRSRRSHGKHERWTRAYHLRVPPPPMPPRPPRGGPRQRLLPTPRGVNMIVWSLDNRFVLAAIMDCRICVWNASDGSLVHSLTGHSESTYVLDVHPFNPRVAMSAGYDGKTIIWDIWEGVPIRTYEIGRFKLVDGKFSPDGTSIVLSDDVGQIYLLNTGQGESQKDSKYDQFFLGDYRPLLRDAHGNVVDQETQLVPYRRNIQDPLCDSSMIPYPEPYQTMFQKRRLGALNLEWRPATINFLIGTDIGLEQDYQIFPLEDLDVVFEPPPEFIDAMYWEPENEAINDSTDSEYNVTEDNSIDDEQGSMSNGSSDPESDEENDISGGNQRDSHRQPKCKKHHAEDGLISSTGRRLRKRKPSEHAGTSSLVKRPKKLRNGRTLLNRKSSQAKLSRPQRVGADNVKNFSQHAKGFSSEEEDESSYDLSGSDSSMEDSYIHSQEPDVEPEHFRAEQSSLDEVRPLAIGTENRKRLVLKFSIRDSKKSIPEVNIGNHCKIQAKLSSSFSGHGDIETSTGDSKELNKLENHLQGSADMKDSYIKLGEETLPASQQVRTEEINQIDSDLIKADGPFVVNSSEPNEIPRPKTTVIRIKAKKSPFDVRTSTRIKLVSRADCPVSGGCDSLANISSRVDEKQIPVVGGEDHDRSEVCIPRVNTASHGSHLEANMLLEAGTERRTSSLKVKVMTQEAKSMNQNLHGHVLSGISKRSSKKAIHPDPTYEPASTSNMSAKSSSLRYNGDNVKDASTSYKSNYATRKTNWLLLSEQEEGCRYIPQLGDQVVYVRQGHQEYIASCNSPERGPWMSLRAKIRDVESCSVEDLSYANIPGSGESCCKVTLKFTDSCSDVFGKTFKLTLPELVNFPEFLVERTRYDAALEKRWSPGDTCLVWWRDESLEGGSWWEGQILSIMDKSDKFPGSPWERYLVHYKNDAEEFHRHSPWELHEVDSRWEQPHIDSESIKKMLGYFSRLQQSASGNQDYYGILKLKQAAEKLDFVNRFPVPFTLEVIQRRLENNYYRSLDAMKHDITVMLSNVESYFARHAELSTKVRRLSDWFARKLERL